MAHPIEMLHPQDSGDFLSQNSRNKPYAEIEEIPKKSYSIRDPQIFSPFSTKGKIIGKTEAYQAEIAERRYTVYASSIEVPEIDFDASDLRQPADILSTHGWMTEFNPGDLYDMRAQHMAKLGHRVISISHVQTVLKNETSFPELASDINAIALGLDAEQSNTKGNSNEKIFYGYSQGAMKAIVAAAMSHEHGLTVDGLLLNRPAMMEQRTLSEVVKQTLPMPLYELPTVLSLLLQDRANFMRAARVFRTSAPELLNHALVIPKLIGGVGLWLAELNYETDVLVTEARRDVFNQDYAYSKYIEEHFNNPTVRTVTGAFSGHLGCGSLKDEKAEIDWLREHNAKRLKSDISILRSMRLKNVDTASQAGSIHC